MQELEKNKIYYILINQRVEKIQVLKKNKISYSVKINNKRETLWFNELEFYLKRKSTYKSIFRNISYSTSIRVIVSKNIELKKEYKKKDNIIKKIEKAEKTLSNLKKELDDVNKNLILLMRLNEKELK